MIDELRQSLRALEKPAGIEDAAGVAPLGVPAVDIVLGGGLARGALHEIAAAGEAHMAATTGFALGVACLPSGTTNSSSPLPSGERSAHEVRRVRGDKRHSLVWIAEDMALAESGAPYGPGLEAFGLAPERLLTVAVAHTRDLLWTMEEVLRCRAVAAVIGELRHGEIDMVAVRRLSLAASESGPLALLLRASPPRDASTAATRWVVRAAPHECFAARLTRNRRGPLGSWILQWSDDDGRFLLATHAQPVAAPTADRPHRQIARKVA
ncbi:MAG: DNA repair protein [Pseudolabrys sp.]